MLLCTDLDLLHWEPNLFRDAAAAAQVMMSGTGDLESTTFTPDSGSPADHHVEAGQVIVLAGAVNGSYPIVGVDGNDLTLSVLYGGLFPAQGEGEPSPVGSGSDLTFAVRTFWPQRRLVSDLIHRAAGIEPDDGQTILNVNELRRPCALGALQLIYSALAAAAEDPAELSLRSSLYERMYRRALRSAKVEIDANGDGRADVVRMLGMVRMSRA
jgi:hypothetical protein